MSKSPISLKQVLVASKNVSAEFPGFPDFVVEVNFLSRETITGIRKKCTTTKFKNRQMTEEVNDELFLELYVKACVKGWKGLKLSYLVQIAPVDLGPDYNPDDELEYTEENALYLMKASTAFDSWISEQVSDLANFQSSSAKK